MLPITDLHIPDFRCLKDFHIKRCGRVNLIVGANGTGKTALLEAIQRRQLDARKRCYYVRHYDVQISRAILLDLKIKDSLFIEPMKLLDCSITDVCTIDSRTYLARGTLLYELINQSHAINRFFLIAAYMLAIKKNKTKKSVLLIDELENGLHWSVQLPLWTWLLQQAKERNIQIFATTQSLDCVKAFSEACRACEDIEGVLISMGRSSLKGEEGKIIATEYDEEELGYILASGMEIK